MRKRTRIVCIVCLCLVIRADDLFVVCFNETKKARNNNRKTVSCKAMPTATTSNRISITLSRTKAIEIRLRVRLDWFLLKKNILCFRTDVDCITFVQGCHLSRTMIQLLTSNATRNSKTNWRCATCRFTFSRYNRFEFNTTEEKPIETALCLQNTVFGLLGPNGSGKVRIPSVCRFKNLA